MKDTDSREYWQNDAARFSSHYQPKAGVFSLRRVVGGFLNSRTKQLLKMADIGQNDAVLDVGCGSGVHVKLFSPKCRNIAGIDYSEQMIASAREFCGDLPVHNWDFKVGDALALPFPDASFDYILSMGLLDYVSSPRLVLEECRRVLKETGRIIFTIPKSPSLAFFLRNSFGDILRDRLFDLPPIRQSLTSRQLEALLGDLHFNALAVRSVWTTMWIVKAGRAGV